MGGLRRLTFELGRPWWQGPMADRSKMVLDSVRPEGLAGAGRLVRRLRHRLLTLSPEVLTGPPDECWYERQERKPDGEVVATCGVEISPDTRPLEPHDELAHSHIKGTHEERQSDAKKEVFLQASQSDARNEQVTDGKREKCA